VLLAVAEMGIQRGPVPRLGQEAPLQVPMVFLLVDEDLVPLVLLAGRVDYSGDDVVPNLHDVDDPIVLRVGVRWSLRQLSREARAAGAP